MDLLNSCARKGYYTFIRDLRGDSESDATLFGSAIHKGLEAWYSLPVEQRQLSPVQKKTADLYGGGHELDTTTTGALEAIRQFCVRARPLYSLADNDKRHPISGIRILSAYFKRYADDIFATRFDADGRAMVERRFEFQLAETSEYTINYFGTIDAILTDQMLGEPVVMDHKTTSMLGAQFFDRFKPNHQYTGYILGAQKVFGINTNRFIINALRVSSANAEFARQVTTREEEDFVELRQQAIATVERWRSYKRVNEYEALNWPMNSPGSCTTYGKCQFHELCSVPNHMRENIINLTYKGATRATQEINQ